MAKQGALSALGKGGMSELWARLRFLSGDYRLPNRRTHPGSRYQPGPTAQTCFDRMRGPFLACSTCFPAARWNG